MTAIITEWKGHKMLEMTDSKGRKISMGKTKIQAVLDNLEAAKVFCITENIPKGMAVADTTNISLF